MGDRQTPSDKRVGLGQSEASVGYDYRIVLEQPNGERLPLGSQGGDLDGARKRLQEILDDADTTYPRGWIERRPRVWQTFCAAQTPRKS